MCVVARVARHGACHPGVAIRARDVLAEGLRHLVAEHEDAHLHRGEHGGVRPPIVGVDVVGLGPLLTDLDHLEEQRGRGLRAVHHRADQVRLQRHRDRMHRRNIGVCHTALVDEFLADLQHPLLRPLVAGLTQRLLRAEVMPDQPRRHTCLGRDIPDRRPLDTALGEQPDSRVPNPGPSGQIIHRPIHLLPPSCCPATHLSKLLHTRVVKGAPRSFQLLTIVNWK